MAKRENDLGRDPVGKLLLRLAIPTVTAQLVNALYNIVDRIYIGHIPEVGDLALTGLGVCFPVILFVSAVSALVGQGGASRAVVRMGEGNLAAGRGAAVKHRVPRLGIGHRGGQCARRVLDGDFPLRKGGQRRRVPAAAQQDLRECTVRRDRQPRGFEFRLHVRG